jgi:glucose/mannose-6-phosphate isomerase
LFDIDILKKIDQQEMYKIYDKWSNIAAEAFISKQKPVNFKNIKHIVFAGMGGSGAIGDMFSSILSKTTIHVNVVKGYLLPQTVTVDSLVIATSVSGNTSETLSIIYAAHKIGCKIIVFSSGGKMQKYCIDNKIEYRMIPKIHSPRASFTSYLYSMLNILHETLDIEKQDIIESLEYLKKINDNINSTNLTKNNESLKLAEWISGVPVIYYPFGLQSAAIRFKNSLQENVKSHAMTEDVIESSHNGIVSWEIDSNVQPILIKGQHDYVKTKERWQILKEYFHKKEIKYYEIDSVDGSILSKLICLIYMLDYSTIYKAALNNIDPSPVKSIDFLKEKLEIKLE